MTKSVIDDLQIQADLWGVSKSLACQLILTQYFIGQKVQGKLPMDDELLKSMDAANLKPVR